MNKYSVILHSDCNESNVWINFLVNTPLTSEQVKTYYECLSLSISKVDVEELEKTNE